MAESDRYVPALGFRFLTPCYDVVVRATTREKTFKRALIRQAEIQKGQHVLDLACGTGTLALWIKQTHPQAHVTGIDGDAHVLSIARRKAQERRSDIRFEQALSFSLPFDKDSFDCVVSSLFFHHLRLEDKLRTAKEVLRVLKPGGMFHIADWGRASNGLMRAAFLVVQALDGFTNTSDNVAGRLIDVFREAGFVGVSERQRLNTILGTMSLYGASKPG